MDANKHEVICDKRISVDTKKLKSETKRENNNLAGIDDLSELEELELSGNFSIMPVETLPGKTAHKNKKVIVKIRRRTW